MLEWLGRLSLLCLCLCDIVCGGWPGLAWARKPTRINDSISEALDSLKASFIDKHLYSQSRWSDLERDIRRMNTTPQALQQLVHRLDDPYMRYLPRRGLDHELKRIHGLRVGIGATFRRGFTTQHLRAGVKALSPCRKLLHLSGMLLPLLPLPGLHAQHISHMQWAGCALSVSSLVLQLLPYCCAVQVTSSEDGSGLQIGDVLLGANGIRVPPWWSSSWLDKGPPGSCLQLSVLRANQRMQLTADRVYLDKPTVHGSVLPARIGAGLGYLQLSSFTTSTLQDCMTAIDGIQRDLLAAQNTSLAGLVIDLRDNGGGVLASALQLASLFAPRGSVLSVIKINNRQRLLRSSEEVADLYERPRSPLGRLLSLLLPMLPCSSSTDGQFLRTPVLLLTNGNTASASEIFVEAMVSAHPLTCTMGRRTLGKNKAQAIVQLSDGSALCFSICEFLAPSGRAMGSGHAPHVLLADDDALDVEEDLRFHPKEVRRWSVQGKSAGCLPFMGGE